MPDYTPDGSGDCSSEEPAGYQVSRTTMEVLGSRNRNKMVLRSSQLGTVLFVVFSCPELKEQRMKVENYES